MLRRGGRADLADGSQVTWSVADGRRGRRWRSAITRNGALSQALLLEVDAAGQPVRLELATIDGLLTLHPEPDGALHGNSVTAGGIRHFTFDWSQAHGLEIEGNPIPTAVTAARLAAGITAGEGRRVPVAIVNADLQVRMGERRFERAAEASWRVTGDGETRILAVDTDGLVGWPDPAVEWPLELDDPR
jgi:hypothetical protein